jgi:ubiquinone biosynthesis protein
MFRILYILYRFALAFVLYPRHKWLVKVFEACGPIFIKLGQSLSLKPYLVGECLANELANLQDKVSYKIDFDPVNFLENTYKKPLSEVFSEFDPKPVSVASIACVFRAKLVCGKLVAVKIIRPNISKIVTQDLDILLSLAKIASRFNKYKSLDLVKIVSSVRTATLNELDLEREFANLSLLRKNLHSETEFRIPFAYEEFVRQNVLVLDWVDGIPLSRLDLIEDAGLNKTRIANQILLFYCVQVYRDGVFHADMHPGNLFVDKHYNIIAIDCGNIGILPYNDRVAVAEIIYGFLQKNYEHVADIYIKAGYVSPSTNEMPTREKFIKSLSKIGENFVGSSDNARPIKVSKLLRDLFEMTEKYGMQTQEQLLMLQKTMLYVEAVVYKLNPKINVWGVVEKWMDKWALQNLGITGRIYKSAHKILDKFLNFFSKTIG